MAGDHVVVFTADAQVTVLDLADGTARWSRRLTSAQGRVEPFDDGRILVVDDDEAGTTSVTLTSIADGAEVSSFAPACPDPVFEESTIEASVDMVLERVPGTDDLVAQFAFGRGCTQRWEATTGTARWARATESSVHIDPATAVSATDMVTVDPTGAVHVSLAEGTVTAIEPPPDAFLSGPVSLIGTTAYLTTTTTRGTPRPGILALDLRSPSPGGPSSSMRAEALETEGWTGSTAFPGTTLFLFVASDDALRLMTIGEGASLTVSDVDPATGRAEVSGTDALLGAGSSSPSVYVDDVTSDQVVLTVDAVVQVVDLETGTVTASWGG